MNRQFFTLAAAFFLISCGDIERDNPNDPGSSKYRGYQIISTPAVEPSSSSAVVSSSSAVPSSSSVAAISSSAAVSSSSVAVVLSSSSVAPSSSSVAQSSSSAAVSSSSVTMPSSSSAVTSSSSIQSGVVSGTPVTYEGEIYETVVIGTQTWFKRNLNYAVEGSKCYNDQESYCAIYGKLYDWSTAMVLPSSCNSNSCSGQIQQKHKGICPTGWHIPSQAEWEALRSYIMNDKGCIYSCEAKHLKATSGWQDDDYGQSGNGLDSYGFSALPGGLSENGYFFGGSGRWSTASEFNANKMYEQIIKVDLTNLSYDYSSKIDRVSVRCLKD